MGRRDFHNIIVTILERWRDEIDNLIGMFATLSSLLRKPLADTLRWQGVVLRM